MRVLNMTELRRFQCLNCGHGVDIEVLTSDERLEATRKNERVSPVAFPQCRRTDIRGGWG